MWAPNWLGVRAYAVEGGAGRDVDGGEADISHDGFEQRAHRPLARTALGPLNGLAVGMV
jgi:hypothetical protein